MESGAVVATTDAQQRAIRDLKTAELMLADLSEVAAEWDQLGEGERVSWSIDWGNEMSGVEALAQYAAHGLLTTEQYGRYTILLQQLREALPTITRLELYVPPVVAEG